MARDPAFLFYDGDAARDVSHMNRLERGCYFDLIQAQRKFGRMTKEVIQKVLGKDFEGCWEALKICLSYDNHMYFINWVEESVKKRELYIESRKNNRIKGLKNNICSSYDDHMENEIVHENVHRKEGVQGEKTKRPILFRNSEYFEFEKFRSALSDWPEGKCREYWQRALDWSDGVTAKGGKEQKKIDWIWTVKTWARNDKRSNGKNNGEEIIPLRSVDELIAAGVPGRLGYGLPH